MLRIPGSHNYKCVLTNGNVANSSTKVKITQKWNGHRPKIDLLLGSFYAWLVDQRIKEIKAQKSIEEIIILTI
jgi:hypothetical protein